jgi:hypothetical protein
MHNTTLITVAIAGLLVVGVCRAGDAAEPLRFELSAEVAAPAFQARRSTAHPPGPIIIEKRLPNGNPHAAALKIDVWGGTDAVRAQLVDHFTLSNGAQHIPMHAIKRGVVMSPGAPIHVAHPHEVAGPGKTLVFAVTGRAHAPPPPGTYTGHFVMLFEPYF